MERENIHHNVKKNRKRKEKTTPQGVKDGGK